MDSLQRWNELPPDEAEADLLTCCAAPAWARAVAAGRPYGEVPAVLAAAAEMLGELPWPDIAEALAAHPRIGERVAGAGREVQWSRREQSGAQGADAHTAAALTEANRAYEAKFDRVFLIFASGRSAEEMLAAARARLANDEQTERAIVRAELGKITWLRLERLFA